MASVGSSVKAVTGAVVGTRLIFCTYTTVIEKFCAYTTVIEKFCAYTTVIEKFCAYTTVIEKFCAFLFKMFLGCLNKTQYAAHKTY